MPSFLDYYTFIMIFFTYTQLCFAYVDYVEARNL